MRLLFVSSTTVGGSGRSQRELAERLSRRGHDVRLLVDDGRARRPTRFVYEQLSDLATRLEGVPGHRLFEWLEGRPGRRTSTLPLDGWDHETTAVPQNAVGTMIDQFQPDVVVGNSLERLAWRRTHRVCSRRGIPTALYVREVDSLRHFVHGETPDLMLANSESLQRALERDGYECAFVPSVIDLSVTATSSTRKVALAINPIPTKGLDIVARIAEGAAEIPIVLQESWPLSGDELAAVTGIASSLANVEFRRAVEPGPELYGDTKLLLVPYRVDSRPRVITEAQANGIPVLAADVPSLREAIGDGGAVVALEDIDAWIDVLRSLWEDEMAYEAMAAAALAHSRRPEIDPDLLAERFESLVDRMLGARAGGPEASAL